MQVSQCIVNINSEQPEAMLSFYRDVVGIPAHPDPNRMSTLVAGETEIVFDSHSDVQGRSPQPERILVNFFVDDVRAEEQRMRAAGVTFIRSAGREEWGGVISTFVDPDGNYAQIIEFRPE